MANNEIFQVEIGNDVYDIRDTSKAPLESPQLTGTPTAPTPSAGNISQQIATTEFVMNAFQANDSMVFKGTIGAASATVTALPATHYRGWTYKVITAANYAGVACEIGDMIVCIEDGTTANNAHWSVIQSNIDGAVTGPTSSVNNRVAVFNGTTGKVIKDSGYTIAKSVPSTAVFTDTKYSASTTSIGSASAGTAIKADDITAWDAGSTPTLGDPISATKISAWNAGSAPTLGDPLTATKITAWSAGTVPKLGTAIPADDITAWNAGTLPSATVENGVLKLTFGTLPSLSYTAKSIPNVTSVGTAPSMTKSDVTIPNVTAVGSVPTLTKTDVSIPNVESVGTAPSLTYSEKTIPNISVTSKNVVTGISES